jgi:pimeloyl-[acyl-carrier protein] methyl ester esterase
MSTPWVFLHGWGYRPDIWDDLRARIDTPSSAPALTAVEHLAPWADDIAREVPEGSVVVGWSLGAMLALQLAATHPPHVSKLILFGATARFVTDATWPHGLDASTVDAFGAGFARAPARTLQRFVALQALHDAQRTHVTAQLSAAVLDADAHSAPLGLGLHCLNSSDLRPLLAQVNVPVLLIHGEHDALMPITAAQWLAKALPGAYLTCVNGAGHAAFVSQPEHCAALMSAFAC